MATKSPALAAAAPVYPVGRRCPVRAACAHPTHCPDCLNGSEFVTTVPGVTHPAHAAAAVAQKAQRAARKAAKGSPAAQRGRRSQRKGKTGEQDAARAFGGRRVPLSGALEGLPNDVLIPAPGQRVPPELNIPQGFRWLLDHGGWRTEAKRRQNTCPWIYTRLATYDWIAFRPPDGPWLYAVTRERWLVGFSPAVRAALRADTAPLGDWRGPEQIRGRREIRQRVETLWTWLTHEDADAILLRNDRADWVVIVDAAHWAAWLAAAPPESPPAPS